MARSPAVGDVMTQVVVSVPPETRIRDVAALLLERAISGVPIVNADGRVLGVVSATDVLRAQSGEAATSETGFYELDERPLPPSLADASGADPRTALEIGTRRVVTLDERTPLSEAAKHMLDLGIHRLIVTRGGRFAGILTATDILKWVAEPAIEESEARRSGGAP